MEKAQIGAAGKSADCDASSPFSRSTSTTGLDSHHALSVGNRSYQSSSSPSSSFMRNNHHMSMAMGTLDHAPPSSVDNSSHSADSCWSSVPTWEHQQPNGGNMEAAAAGEYASSGWDIKSGWDWEAFVPVSGRGDGGRRLPSSDFDLGGSGAVPKSSAFNLGAVSMASAASGGTSQKAFTSGAFASSTPSAISQGSGIPGLAPTGGGAHGNFSSPSEHTFTPDSSARNAGMDFRVKAEVETPLGLDPQQEQARKSGSLQDLRASSRKTSPNAGVIPDQQANGMSPIGSPQQHQPQTQQQPQQQQRASSQASMLGMGNGIEQQRRLYLGLGGVSREVDDNINNNSSGSSKGTASEDVKDGAHTNGVDGAAVVGEAALGLKLGRRTYFEDGPAGVGTATGTRTAANSPGFAGSPPGKKQRSQPPVMQIPRCQVEGCKADLSNAKEYHRRHKVCEVHSKAAKVIVNKQEQRFCQQCSRFHELSEFDEGKRSCRRRLAGHNERRRKPQPDSGSAITCVNPSLQTSFYGDDDKRNGVGVYLHQRGVPSPTCLEDSDDGNSLKLNHVKSPWPGMGRMDEQSSLACQIQGNGAERPYLSRVPLAHPATTSDRLLMLLQSSPKSQIAPMSSGMSASGVHQFLQGPGPIGQGLTLSSPSGAGVLAGLEATPASQGLSGISDSGRALSLLSSQPWVSRATSSVSLDLSPRSTLTLDQLLAENRAPLAQQLMSSSSAGGQQHFSPLIDKLSMQPHSPGNLGVSGTLSINGSGSGDRDHHGPFMSGYQDFGSHSMLALLQGQEIRASLQSGNGQHVRPTIDLMQLPSPQSQSNHHATRIGALQSQSGQYSDFALRGFESSMFDTQQML